MNEPLDEFEITMSSFRGAGGFRFLVQLIYSSDQVDRFRLIGGNKIMELQKYLDNRRKPWKVLKINFDFEIMDEFTVRTLHHIWDLIDQKRYGKTKLIYQARP